MINNKILSGILATALVSAMASCSIFKGTGGNSSGAGSGVKPAVVTPAPSQAEPSVTAPEVQDNIAGTPVTKAATAESPASELANKLNGEWTIVEAGQYKIDRDEEMPYVNFSEADGRFYANNGCNVVNGNFTFKDADMVAFSNVITTRMYCPDVNFENAINLVLADGNAVKAKIERKGNENYLRLYDSAGNKVMTLRKHNLEVLNGQWNFSTLDGQKVGLDGVNIFFDSEENTVHGNTGCNYFNGGITFDAQKPNSLSFMQMAVTMRMCENSDIERKMLVALEQTATYSIDGKTLTLYDEKGQPVATLTREK